MLFGLKLKPFIKGNLPDKKNEPPSQSQIKQYTNLLPDALLQVWRKHGFGFYGEMRIRLVDPFVWQTVVDQWVISPADNIQRTPIAITPFGDLLIYRQMPNDEDIMLLNPISRSCEVLNYDLVSFFNDDLNDKSIKDSLVPNSLLASAIEGQGPLETNEIYSIDQTLEQVMLKIEKADAFSYYSELRKEIDVETMPSAPLPETLGEAIPADYRHTFVEGPNDAKGVSGLYASVYLDWHKLLQLKGNNSYQLLFWQIHDVTGERSDMRFYTGHYEHRQDDTSGDEFLTLDIELNHASLGSDAQDEELVIARSNGKVFLLQVECLEDFATDIGSYGSFPRKTDVFERTRMNDPLPQDGLQEDSGIAVEDLPAALRDFIHPEPLKTKITKVDVQTESENITVWVDLGTKDGLRKNMPLKSTKESGKFLKGWVWDMDETSCGVGLQINEDHAGNIDYYPEVGDVLVTRNEED